MSEPSHSQLSSPAAASTLTGVVRIIDAESNRAAEGLRVIEDYVRFVLDDQHLTKLAKQLRHDLTAALSSIAILDRLAARESMADVGAEISNTSEAFRLDAIAVVIASFKRAQQAIRSLEEYIKVIDGTAAQAIEALRYRLYTLERAVGITNDALLRLSETRLYVLIHGCSNENEFSKLVETLVTAGVDALQLREKLLSDRQLLSRARQLRQMTTGTKTLFFMNDRPDLAILANADGVHVGQEELSVKDIRSMVGPKMLVGVSTHSLPQARQAVLDGANYIGIGPTFPSNTKSFEKFTGVDLLQQIAAEIRLPAFAIGGITRDNLPQVIAAGIRRVAVSGAIINAKDVAAEAVAMRQSLSKGI